MEGFLSSVFLSALEGSPLKFALHIDHTDDAYFAYEGIWLFGHIPVYSLSCVQLKCLPGRECARPSDSPGFLFLHLTGTLKGQLYWVFLCNAACCDVVRAYGAICTKGCSGGMH